MSLSKARYKVAHRNNPLSNHNHVTVSFATSTLSVNDTLSHKADRLKRQTQVQPQTETKATKMTDNSNVPSTSNKITEKSEDIEQILEAWRKAIEKHIDK